MTWAQAHSSQLPTAERPACPNSCAAFAFAHNPLFAEIEVQVRNGTSAQITVQSIRALEAQSPFFALDGPASADRVLSDSFSEDRPNMVIHDLAQSTDGMHRAVGSQLIYNRQSRQSLFLGALTSEKWLTVLRLDVDDKQHSITAATRSIPPALRNSPRKTR